MIYKKTLYRESKIMWGTFEQKSNLKMLQIAKIVLTL